MSGEKARRGTSRPQLDRDVIVAAALELAAAEEAVTFRSLGTALGSDPTAVYRHFRDKDELMRAVVDRLIVLSQDELDSEASWREQLYDGAVATMDVFAAHPHVGVDSSTIATGGPGELSAINWILTQLERAGLDKEQAVRFYAAYSSYMLAAASSLSIQRLRNNGAENASWVGDQRAVDAMRYPAVAAAINELVSLSDRDVFLMGIDVLLDAAEAAAKKARRAG